MHIDCHMIAIKWRINEIAYTRVHRWRLLNSASITENEVNVTARLPRLHVMNVPVIIEYCVRNNIKWIKERTACSMRDNDNRDFWTQMIRFGEINL